MEKGGIELGKGGRALDLEKEVRGERRGSEVREDCSDNSFDALNPAAPSFLCIACLLSPWPLGLHGLNMSGHYLTYHVFPKVNGFEDFTMKL